ncbi:MAG TPA: hypothetical protein VJ483_05930 [Holophagaceae bacterium]|nr:hypothetical protein [Holophagaceae bacterium]
MSAASSRNASELQGMLQELKGNRRTQAALLVFAAVIAWMGWTIFGSEQPKAKRPATAAAAVISDPRLLQNLKRLPDLAALDKAGELPPKPKLVRDLFLFEGPKPPPPPPKPVAPPPPPPPPTQAELEAREKQQARDSELATKPQDLRYIGFMKGNPSGLIGAFMKGEEAITLPQGTVVANRWKLVSVTDTQAQFQNLKYQDLKFSLQAADSSAAPTAANNF